MHVVCSKVEKYNILGNSVHGSLVHPGSVISLITCYIVSALIKEPQHGTLEVFYAGDMSLFPGITDSSNRVMNGLYWIANVLRPRLIKPTRNPNSRPLFTTLIPLPLYKYRLEDIRLNRGNSYLSALIHNSKRIVCFH